MLGSVAAGRTGATQVRRCTGAAPADDALPFGAIVVAPTYNNASTLGAVLDAIKRLGLPAIVVDDGSTDDTPNVLAERLSLRSLDGEAPPLKVLTHALNRGKAAALRTGFDAAWDLGFSHAVTIDTDGQLEAADIPSVLAAAERNPSAIVIGVRDEQEAGYPARSRIGRYVSNFMVKLESGVRVADSQCGLRAYPLEIVRFVNCRSQRYGFETAILTRFAWAGCTLAEVPVACHYPPDGQRISHFRPWMDSWRGIGMHIPLVARAMWPWPHRKWHNAPRRDPSRGEAAWRRFVQSVNPAAAYRQLKTDDEAGAAMAVSVGVGVWIANLPLYGVQTVFGIYTARRLHLNPLAVVLGTQLSTPPIGPLLVAAAIALGHVLLHGSLPALADLDVRGRGWGWVIVPIFIDWIIGGVFLGLVLGVITFFATWPLFRRLRRPPVSPSPTGREQG